MTRNWRAMTEPDDGGKPSPIGRATAHMARVVRPMLEPAPADQGVGAVKQAALIEMAARLEGAVGDLSKALRGVIPKVLGTELIALDASGTATRSYRVPYQSLAVSSRSGNVLTVASSALLGAAPGPGPGAGQVPVSSFAVLNLSGYVWSIYGGNPGDLITVTTFGQAQPPDVSPGPLTGALLGAVSLASDYPSGAVAVTGDSGNQANANAVATLPGVAGKTTWITGFEITGSGATSALVVTVTVAGPANTLHYTYAFVAGATLLNVPLVVEFPKPVPAAAANTAIVVTCPASGLGGTNLAAVAHGYQL